MNAAPDNGCLRNSFGTLCMPHEDGTGPRTLAHGSPMHYAYARRLHLPRVSCVILCSRRPTGFKVVFFSWQFFTSSPTTPLYFFHHYYLRFTHTRPLAHTHNVSRRRPRSSRDNFFPCSPLDFEIYRSGQPAACDLAIFTLFPSLFYRQLFHIISGVEEIRNIVRCELKRISVVRAKVASICTKMRFTTGTVLCDG